MALSKGISGPNVQTGPGSQPCSGEPEPLREGRRGGGCGAGPAGRPGTVPDEAAAPAPGVTRPPAAPQSAERQTSGPGPGVISEVGKHRGAAAANTLASREPSCHTPPVSPAQ